MIEFFQKLFDTTDFPKRWNCGDWSPGLGWLHIISDLLTWGSYTAIPIVLAIYIVRRPGVYFPGLFWLFCMFIFSCGSVHLVEAIIFWQPVYRLSGLVKLLTALFSCATVIALIRVAPSALKLPLLRDEILQKEQITNDLQKQLHIAALFEKVSQIANATSSAEILFTHSASAMVQLAQVDAVRIWETNENKDAFVLSAIDGHGIDRTFHHGEVSVAAVREAIRLNQPVQSTSESERGQQRSNDSATNSSSMPPHYVSFPILRDDSMVCCLIEIFSAQQIEQETVKLMGPTIDVLRTGYFRLIAEKSQAELITELEQRNEEVAQRNAELDEFTYVASHDLRAPLRAIQALSQMITEDEFQSLSQPGKEKLDLLGARVVRMNRLLDDLLAYSRVGRKKGSVERIDTRQLVNDIVELLGVGSNVNIRIASEMPVLVCERAPLEQVFRNLIDNAIKHHHREDPNITISCRTIPEYYEFCIADDGPGINKMHHERVFKMFETLRPRDEVEGSGMGLALIRKFAAAVGGFIRLESEPGEGCRFYVSWPRKADDNGKTT